MHSDYLVATPAGIEHFTEQHDLAVFTVEEYLPPSETPVWRRRSTPRV